MVCNSDSYYWNLKNFKAIYTFVRVSTFSWCICLAEACSNSPKMTGSVTTSAVRMWLALHYVKSIMQVLQPLKSMSGLMVRRDIYYMYLNLHAKACYRANRTIDFYSDGKLLPFMVIGREGPQMALANFGGLVFFILFVLLPWSDPFNFAGQKDQISWNVKPTTLKKHEMLYDYLSRCGGGGVTCPGHATWQTKSTGYWHHSESSAKLYFTRKLSALWIWIPSLTFCQPAFVYHQCEPVSILIRN